MFIKRSLPVKILKILVPALYKTAISRKTKSFGTFWLFFLDSMDLWHYLSNYSKRFIDKLCSLLQAKHLVVTQERGGKDGPFLCLQQNVGVKLHMI